MKPPPFKYLRASSVDEAVSALQSEEEARVLAGGQSLIAMMNLRAAYPKCLIDINSIGELDDIAERDNMIAVGALTRLNTLKGSVLVAKYCPLLAEALGFIANKTVRNRATIGGNVCHADPASEIPAVLIATGAQLVIKGADGERLVEAENFFQGMYTTAVADNELLVEIQVPKIGKNAGTAISEFSSRKGDFGIAVVATELVIEDGVCGNVRLVATGIGPHAARIEAAEAALRGQLASEKTIEAAGRAAYNAVEPTSDFHADETYRRELVETLTGRVVRLAAARAVGEA
jgi:carbon-monoxide dehydrogenase medium subunit